MKYLVFDTETTGFPRVGIDCTHPSQARVCQIAWALLDERFREVSCFKALVCSEGKWSISQGAFEAHGISQHDCDTYGMSMRAILPMFLHALGHVNMIAAHNIMFDLKMLDIECDVFFFDKHNWTDTNRYFCTMNAMTPICKLEQKNGKAGFKWPKLREAYMHCFGEELKDAHDALVDVRATARILKWLNENRCLPITQS